MKRFKIAKVSIMKGDIEVLDEIRVWLAEYQPQIEDKDKSDRLKEARVNLRSIIRDFTEEFNNEI